MFLSTRIGMFLRDSEERSLVREAARLCGLEPVDLSPATVRQSQIIVTDWGLPELAVVTEDARRPGTDAAPLVILVRNARTGDDPEDQAVALLDTQFEYPWTLYRPLSLKAVQPQLLQAAQINRVFGQRNHALTEELHRARGILDSMSNSVTVVDATLPDLPLVYVNPAFERMTGYAAGEVFGRNCRFLQGADTGQPAVAEIWAAICERRDLRTLIKNYRKDGTPFWNELYMSPMFDLEGRLTHFVGFQNDVTERIESARKVEYLAQHDGLTGLANRGLMMERLKRALPRAIRNGTNVAVLFLDLNNFKQVNDVFGHEAGDRLLQAVANRLKSSTRQDEMVARLGGDEFVVLLEDISGNAPAAEVKQRVTDLLGQVYDLCGQPFHPAASVGMALFPRDGDNPEALLRAADRNMYVAKNGFHRTEDRSELSAATTL